MNTPHQPVLLDQVIRLLDPKSGQSFFDGTAGYGGHAEAIISRTGAKGRVVLVDRDSQAIKALQQRFGDRAEIIRANYADAAKNLAADGSLFDLILLDLGVSSPQLDQPERGFTFQADEPLDMRMDRSQALTAYEVVNSYQEKRLADVIYQFGEERRSRAVARAIVNSRPILTTGKLASIVQGVVRRSGKTNPATRTFQAIRIEVNGELQALSDALPELVRLLAPGGRLAVISFHSLEDRIVKHFIAARAKEGILENLTRKVVKGSDHDVYNPRARSAKLRAAVKIKNQKEGI